MNGLEDTYFSGYSRHLKNENQSVADTNSVRSISGFEHESALKSDLMLPSDNFEGFSKRRVSDRYGKAPDYFNFGYKDNFSDAENSNATGFTDKFSSNSNYLPLIDKELKSLAEQQNLAQYSNAKNLLSGQNASYLDKISSPVFKEWSSGNTFAMDAGGLKKHTF